MTGHRIAGPYIRLNAAFDELRNGNLDYRVKFRDYDHLEEVEEAFNVMAAKIQETFGARR